MRISVTTRTQIILTIKIIKLGASLKLRTSKDQIKNLFNQRITLKG